jgi:hypothetical protein
MKISKTIAAAVGFAFVPMVASAAVIGGTYYAPEYDYGEFFWVADHHDFKVVLVGNPFPGTDMGSVARDLLPLMQAAKPRPALTFAYDVEAVKDQPDYRLVLVFDPANDLAGEEVCNGASRLKPGRPGLFNAYAVYCRNDMVMSETTAWTLASSANDPRVAQLFRELFMVVFPDSHALKPNVGDGNRN